MTSVVERSTVQPEADRSASAADDSEQAEPLTDEEYGTLLWVKIGELRYDASNARSFMQGGAYHTVHQHGVEQHPAGHLRHPQGGNQWPPQPRHDLRPAQHQRGRLQEEPGARHDRADNAR